MRKILILILLIAALLRFIGIYPGYNQFHPDEGMSYLTAAAMLKEKTLVPQEGYRVKFAYPYLVPLINFSLFKYLFVPLGWISFAATNLGRIADGLIHFPLIPEEERRIFQLYILGEREVNTIFWARTVTAFFGVGNVLLIYFLGSKLVSRKVGLIAAFLLAFNFRQVTNSHLALPDIYNSFFLNLSLLACINLWRNPSKRAYLLAGILSGLAFSVKFQFFPLVPLIVAHFLAVIDQKKGVLSAFNRYFWMSLVTIPLVLLITNPFHLVYLEETLVQVVDVALKYGMGTKKVLLFPISYLYHIDFGPPLFILAGLGIFWGLFKYFKQSLLLLSVLVPQAFIFFYFSYGGFHVRNLIPMTPLLIIFAAILLSQIKLRLPLFLFLPLLVVVIFIPARNSLISDYYYTKPWNFNQLSEWLYKNPLDAPVAAHPMDPPTGSPPLTKTQFTHNGAFSMAEHIENRAEYALINTDWAANNFYNWMIYGPKDIQTRWSKPLGELRNSYSGLALEELLNYQIFAAIKPWQAPEANLILTEFPVWPKAPMTRILDLGDLTLTQTGHGRVSLTPIPAKEGHLYKVSAILKSDQVLESHARDGFIRVDFGTTTCVSSRVFDKGFLRKDIYCLAPKGSGEITISLQVENTGNTIRARDIEVWESEGVVKRTPGRYPYIENKVELDIIYPNSHANL